MQERGDIINFLQEKERECKIIVRAYDHWLGILTPVRWLTIFVGVLFPAVAGVTLLNGKEVYGVPWQTIAALLTFTASVVAALHAAFHCESHQVDCARLRARYRSLVDELQLATTLDEKALRKKTDELALKLVKLNESVTEVPMKWARDKAEREMPPTSL